jgi:hypothetical protein
MNINRILTPLLVASVLCFALASFSAPAFAETCPEGSVYASCAPGWALTASTFPTTIPANGEAELMIDVMNVGAGSSKGTVTVTDTLPRGVTATAAGDLSEPRYPAPHEYQHALWNCAIAPGNDENSVVACTNNQENMSQLTGGGGNPTNLSGPDYDPMVGITIKVPGASVATANRVAIAGGGAATSASAEDPIEVGSIPGPFRFTNWDVWFSNADGTLDTQAGSHPYEATFSFNLAAEPYLQGYPGSAPVGGEAREVVAELPRGFVGNPTVVAQCTREGFDEKNCPNGSQIGIIAVTVALGLHFHADVFNMVPPAGVADQIGFEIQGNETFIDTGVRTGSDYGLTSRTVDTPQKSVTAAVLTLWGEPADPSHNQWRRRGGGCEFASEGCESPGAGQFAQPFLTLPTQCGGPQSFSIRSNTWEHPEVWTEQVKILSHDSNHEPIGFTGCEHLGFGPLIDTAPDTSAADTPAGLTVEVKPPIGGLTDPEGLSTSDIQNTTVVLPAGLVVNPGQAAGLEACGPGEDGLTTEAERARGEEDAGPSSCPLKSKVGTVEIKTPLLEGLAEKELEGNVYVLQSNPPELKLLVAASADGVNLKLVGIVHLCEATGQAIGGDSCAAPGQLIATFQGTPELPFTVFKLSFSGGAQAALDTPTQCGTYSTDADFDPWSSPFVQDFATNAGFGITAGPNGVPCLSSPLPFGPELVAGSTTDQAGGFTHFSLLLQRGDGQQRIDRLQFRAPAGLGGMLSTVALCGEPQAAQGTCSAASRIGHASVASGPGPYPLALPQPGAPEFPIYLTGPYEGAPFGLSIVTPIVAGPFDLGTIVTRAKIEIDPHTAQITVTTDPLPQEVDGVPTDLRLVDSVIDREGFMFNPTNCGPQSFAGTAWGAAAPGQSEAGETAPISSHFGVGSCRSLEFAPKFSVSTSGKTSKADGASLTAKVAYPVAPQGTQADIGSVKVELPKQLPSRLTTLQKACTNAQFEADPAACPAASKIGYAVVHTPELPVALTGPAIFVSHGGEAFPSLTMVLQGDGVTIDLVGTTFISKAGVTSTTFKTVPDAPFSTFELTLPEGEFSALTALGNLCTEKLVMPAEFVGQNGASLEQNAPVGVSGCSTTLAVVSRSVNKKTLKLRVYAPAAGKVTVTGKGVGRTSKASSSHEDLTLTLHATRSGKFATNLKISFTPSKGKHQSKTLKIKFTK